MIQYKLIRDDGEEGDGVIRIEELFRLEHISGLRVIAGEKGLSRRVTAAVLFEYDPSRMLLADFYRGDLVVTTLAFARGDEELVQGTLMKLMNQGVAGLLIKTAYFKELPQAILAMADRLGTPLLLFDDTYIEEVILEVTELIRGCRHFAGHERELDALMGGGLGAGQVRELVQRLDPIGARAYGVYALSPREGMSSLEDRLYDALYGDEGVSHRFVCLAWRRMLLVLCRLAPGEERGELSALLARAKVDAGSLFVGESFAPGGASLGAALCEAVYAAKAARLSGRARMASGELGLYAYLLPMSESAFIRERCAEGLRLLRAHDEQSHASLEATAQAYVENGMEIAATARALFQHPNTVRYRLSKIRALLGAEDERTLDLLLLIMIRLSRIVAGEEYPAQGL